MSQAASLLSRSRIAVRDAVRADIPVLRTLIERSARDLSRGFYDDAETRAAIAHVFGVDTQLIDDGTYFVAEEEGRSVGCGGWSRRATLFGGDQFAGRSAATLDPAVDAARIRAFFVDPDHARRGIAGRLLDACEHAARSAGFRRAELMATLPGVPFYTAAGFVAGEPIRHQAGDTLVRFVPMTKSLSTAFEDGAAKEK